MNNPAKTSSFGTLTLMVLKELRIERGVHQGYIAQILGKTPSAWTKIENGQSPLTIDVLFGACNALQIWPSYVIQLVERLVPAFGYANWYFQTMPLQEEEDELLQLFLAYFSSPGYSRLKARPGELVSIPIGIGNVFTTSLPTVVRYCTEPEFKAWMDKGAPEYSQVNNAV